MDVPQGIPRLRMVVAHAHADAFVFLEAAVRRHHFDPWRLQRVLLRDDYSAEVIATFIRTVLEAKDDVVPNIKIIGVGRSDKILQRIALDDPLG